VEKTEDDDTTQTMCKAKEKKQSKQSRGSPREILGTYQTGQHCDGLARLGMLSTRDSVTDPLNNTNMGGKANRSAGDHALSQTGVVQHHFRCSAGGGEHPQTGGSGDGSVVVIWGPHNTKD